MRPELSVVKRVHMVGIGGSGMSGIAEILHNMGFKVTGSDIQENENVKRLRALEIKIEVGHRPENLSSAQVVVISSAIREDNVEVQRARQMGIPVIPRAEALAQLMRMKYSIAVAGTHGKTTTTSMIGFILAAAGYDPTIVVGGIPHQVGATAKMGKGKFMVAEADESDGSFLRLYPSAEVITNIEEDHLDFYPNIEAIREAFLRFTENIPFFGFVVLNRDDPGIREIEGEMKRYKIGFSIKEPSEFQAKPLGKQGDFWAFEIRGHRMKIRLPGLHNIYNASAAVALCATLGLPMKTVASALEEFRGVRRRIDYRGEAGGRKVYEDYAHHPTEIRAVIGSLREIYPAARLVVVFQPHRYTRLAKMKEKLALSLSGGDLVVITEVYPAGEKPIEGISGKVLYDLLREVKGEVLFCRELHELPGLLKEITSPGDVIALLGAGSITKYVERIKGALNED